MICRAMSLRRSCPSAMLTSRPRVRGHQGKFCEGRDPDRGLSFVACGRHERAEADGSADANSRITSRLGDAVPKLQCRVG